MVLCGDPMLYYRAPRSLRSIEHEARLRTSLAWRGWHGHRCGCDTHIDTYSRYRRASIDKLKWPTTWEVATTVNSTPLWFLYHYYISSPYLFPSHELNHNLVLRLLAIILDNLKSTNVMLTHHLSLCLPYSLS